MNEFVSGLLPWFVVLALTGYIVWLEFKIQDTETEQLRQRIRDLDKPRVHVTTLPNTTSPDGGSSGDWYEYAPSYEYQVGDFPDPFADPGSGVGVRVNAPSTTCSEHYPRQCEGAHRGRA